MADMEVTEEGVITKDVRLSDSSGVSEKGIGQRWGHDECAADPITCGEGGPAARTGGGGGGGGGGNSFGGGGTSFGGGGGSSISSSSSSSSTSISGSSSGGSVSFGGGGTGGGGSFGGGGTGGGGSSGGFSFGGGTGGGGSSGGFSFGGGGTGGGSSSSSSSSFSGSFGGEGGLDSDTFFSNLDDFINRGGRGSDTGRKKRQADDDTLANINRISPKELKLDMRKGSTYSFTMNVYRPKDYPADLYYLMDLSDSMKDDLENLKGLAETLTDQLRILTKNFNVGFGAFVDKTVSPYVDTSPAKLLEPLPGAAPPFSYINALSLTHDAELFKTEVGKIRSSGNLDAAEGGFDGMLQALVCRQKIGWREASTHIILYASDAPFHSAGDGKLGGIVKKNDEKCHLDVRGKYTEEKNQDYPSISQIRSLLEATNTLLIFAVDKKFQSIYESLANNQFAGLATAGVLEADSSNIIALIERSYNQLLSQIELNFVNFPSEYMSYTVTPNCGRGQREGSKCTNVQVGDEVTFKVDLTMNDIPEDSAMLQPDYIHEFKIKPVGFHEELVAKLKYLGSCDCEKNAIQTSRECNLHGTFECGQCVCDSGWLGKTCTCDASNNTVAANNEGCIMPGSRNPDPCERRGTCLCGECNCDRPERFSGRYCECDNQACERFNGAICGGPAFGTCDCGTCKCKEGREGSACQCPSDRSVCKPSNAPADADLCNGHGECACNDGEDQRVCVCEEGYSGRFCEECQACPGKCDQLKPCVQCHAWGKNWTEEVCVGRCVDKVYMSDRLRDDVGVTRCAYTDDDGCKVHYTYGTDSYKGTTSDDFVIEVRKNKDCVTPFPWWWLVLGIILAILLLGLCCLCCWRCWAYYKDKQEFLLWQDEMKAQAAWDTGDSAIYTPPVTTHHNPEFIAGGATVVDGGLVNATAPVAAAAPMINLDLKDKLVVKTGSVIILDIPFSGRPTPDIVWTKDDVEIYSGDRVTIENAATSTTLSIKNCQRSDAGNYRLALANTAGRAKADVDVVVIDKPGPPKEVRVDDIMQDSVALSWRQPMDDGGSNITNYSVEKFDYDRNNWVMVNPYVPGFNYTVPNLVPGGEYLFRVAAENQCGVGEPTESERIMVQSRHGRPPGVPGTLTYEEVTGDRVTLRWSPPLDDGGSEVTNYVIQKRDSNDAHGWTTVSSSATRTSHRVGNLNPGGHYRFRVRAENYYGPGPWTESGSVMLGGSLPGRGQVQQSMSSFSTLPAGMSFQQPAYIIAQAPMQSATLPYGASFQSMPGWGSMTMQQEVPQQQAAPPPPKPDPIGPVLRQGVTLVGKDFTEVLLMLMRGNPGMPDPLARFYAYQPMDQMGEQQLNDCTSDLCGFKPKELLILCGLTPNRPNTLILCHYLIILANEERSHHPNFNSLEDVLGTVKQICKKRDLSYDAISLINALTILVELGRKYRHEDCHKYEKALQEARTNITNRELGRIILTILGLNVVVVKVNVTLKNKDITPLLLCLKDGDVDLPPNGEDLCRFKLDTPLDQMTDDELRENIEELSGFTPENLLELIQMPPTRQNVLALAHLMIQRANEDLPVTPAAMTPKARSRTSSQSSGTGQELTGPERAARVGRKLDWLETALEEAAVKQALNCARLSASKPPTDLDRDSLLRSLENLEDVTKQYQHPEWRYYQETLTIARQSVSDPNLGKLVLALIGKPS
ncbi:PREDICTED: uncharacterized protein LOC109478062 isoform X2 [Branchiostoma belcheri]|uniref:Integrin beta n=1 Tax=Branchiostoma belcheri TaxID=7741 RepID=A0A6P4ZZQ8_BRABE|nr:PREDICTED: uncharacterized protein LOC109478062 isoform X2 [Branchiostoma belcheri]